MMGKKNWMRHAFSSALLLTPEQHLYNVRMGGHLASLWGTRGSKSHHASMLVRASSSRARGPVAGFVWFRFTATGSKTPSYGSVPRGAVLSGETKGEKGRSWQDGSEYALVDGCGKLLSPLEPDTANSAN